MSKTTTTYSYDRRDPPRDFSEVPLPELMSKAAFWRGDHIAQEEPIEARIRSAGHQLAFGVSEEDAAQHLMSEGATAEDAFLAVKAAKMLG